MPMPEIDFGTEQIHLAPPGCPECGGQLAIGEKAMTGTVRGDWAERFGVADGEKARAIYLEWVCVADRTHETFPPPKPTLEPA